nr:N-acetylmuramoyl-L-alanine amidase [bacterium]
MQGRKMWIYRGASLLLGLAMLSACGRPVATLPPTAPPTPGDIVQTTPVQTEPGNTPPATQQPTPGDNVQTTPLQPAPGNTPPATPRPTPQATARTTPSALPQVTPTPVPPPTPGATPKPSNTPAPAPLAGLKICIDPGHQGKGNMKELEPVAPWDALANPTYNNTVMKGKCTAGTQGWTTGVAEYKVNLEIALALRDRLRALGADVLMTRESHDVNLSNRERARMANDYGADLTLRIHCNSSTNTDAQGIELYVRGAGDGTAAYQALAQKDYALAAGLLDSLARATGAKARGVFATDAYTGINWCEKSCIIVECGFMSNAQEDALLVTGAYQRKLVDGLVDGVMASAGKIKE